MAKTHNPAISTLLNEKRDVIIQLAKDAGCNPPLLLTSLVAVTGDKAADIRFLVERCIDDSPFRHGALEKNLEDALGLSVEIINISDISNLQLARVLRESMKI